jgi:hypothetical protein
MIANTVATQFLQTEKLLVHKKVGEKEQQQRSFTHSITTAAFLSKARTRDARLSLVLMIMHTHTSCMMPAKRFPGRIEEVQGCGRGGRHQD